jgi:hypothetical protein
MRQKQLFLIVLGVLLVGVVLAVGMNYFHNKKAKQNRNEVIKDLNTLAAGAQEYYKKLNEQGGANKSFLGYEIPLQLKSNNNGSYKIISVTPDSLIIQGTGVETLEQNFSFNWGIKITYEIVIQPDRTELRQIY